MRERTDDDLDDCCRLASEVHELDGYPPHLPDSLATFLSRPRPINAWVAEEDGRIIGHVALNPRSSDQVMELAAEATDRPPESLAVVARLLVAREARRQGVGASLLRLATDGARNAGRHAVLDVAVHFAAAIRLYESSGWTRAGTVTTVFRNGDTLDEYVYLAPPV